MAITIAANPWGGAMNPVVNDVAYSISSTNSGQSNFKYVCDVYPAGVTAPIRIKQPAETNGYAYIDIKGILKSYVTRNAPTTYTVGFSDASSTYINYTVQFGEEYGASSAVTVYPNLTSHTGAAWNASFAYNEWINSANMTGYATGNSSRKFLTAHPTTSSYPIKITTTEWYTLYLLNHSSAAYNCIVKTYDSSGNLLQTAQFGTNLTTTNKIVMFGVGPVNLNNLTGSEPRYSASLPIIDSSVSYYDVIVTNSSSSTTSKTVRFSLIDGCTKYSVYRLMWQNRYSGYDQFSFYGSSQKTSEIKRDFYKRRQGSWNGSSTFRYGSTDRSNAQYNTIIQDSIKINSDWITETESTWLEDLISSPDVYYYDTTYSEWYSCNIMDSNYIYKTRARDTIFNLELTMQPSFNRYKQQW